MSAPGPSSIAQQRIEQERESLRRDLAVQAMHALISNPNVFSEGSYTRGVGELAVRIADELLAELAKEQP